MDLAETTKEPKHAHPLRTILHPNPLPRRQTHSGINPLFQTVINPQPPQTTWTDQLCFSLQHGHYSNPSATNLQHTTNRSMYNLKSIKQSTLTMHQITNQPMKHTTHKRTQWSQSIKENGQYQCKYTYQLQQSDEAHHTKHTPLNTINVH